MEKDKPLEFQLFYLLEKTNKLVRRHAEQAFRSEGCDLTIDQWLTLKKINDAGEISQVEIAEALFKDKASITRILDLLKEKKLIQKVSGVDKRISLIILSIKGKELVQKLLKPVMSTRAKAVETFSKNEIVQLKNALERISQNLE
jgi:MarR family transcriptional regulator, transcriptional regulator for hemolysin